MHHHEPPGNIAPHIPADVYQTDAYRRAQATGQPVVIVVNNEPTGFPWRRILLPFAIAGAVVAGGWGLAAALCWLMDVAAHTATAIAGAVAGPIGVGGITLKLFQPKNK